MYLRKLLIAIVISCAMVGNSVAMAATSMNQSSRINDMIASGDIVINQDFDSDIRLSVLENPEDIDAGFLFTISVLDAFYITHKPIIDAVIAGALPEDLEVLVQSPEFKSMYEDYLNTVVSTVGPTIVSAALGTVSGGAAFVFDIFSMIPLVGGGGEYQASLDNTTDPNTIQSLSELVKGGEFSTSSDLVYWTEKSNAESGYSSFGSISYPGASSDQLFGFVHTGLGAISNQGFIRQTILPLKPSLAVFNVRYNFVTTEFPQYLGSQFNDSFVIKIEDITSGATKVLASFSGSLNTLFDPNDPVVQNLPAEFLDMVASGGGQTGWVTVSTDQIALMPGGEYRIYIDVNDVGDSIYDSALLIDKVSLR